MSQKVAVTFKRGWGVYNAGETAGFDADQAKRLEDSGIAVKAKDQPKAGVEILTLNLDVRSSPAFQEAMAEIDVATAQLDRRETALLEREAELDARADALDARERAVLPQNGDAERVADVVDEDGVILDEATAAPPKSAGLPKQGK